MDHNAATVRQKGAIEEWARWEDPRAHKSKRDARASRCYAIHVTIILSSQYMRSIYYEQVDCPWKLCCSCSIAIVLIIQEKFP